MTWKRKIPGEGACGPCCSWKERFNQLWDRAIGCITKINNITPDGDGKFEIRGGTGVQVTPISNGVEINVSDTPEDVVYSVNGELPDANGDVTIDTGVMTINSIAPDADGEFTISAGSNITLTPGTNSIEIAAAGSTPTAKLPIYIDGDGDIALKGWVRETSYDWTTYVDSDNTLKEDVIIQIFITSQVNYTEYLPAGYKLNELSNGADYMKSGSGTISIYGFNFNTWLSVFNNAASILISTTGISIGTGELVNTIRENYSIGQGGTTANVSKTATTGNRINLFRRA